MARSLKRGSPRRSTDSGGLADQIMPLIPRVVYVSCSWCFDLESSEILRSYDVHENL